MQIMGHTFTKKEIKKIHAWLRRGIQLLYFIFIPSVYTAAFGGAKYIAAQVGAGEAIEWTSFTAVLVTVCLYTVLFGRFFCGYACAFGSFGDAVHGIYTWSCKKIKKKPIKLSGKIAGALDYLKYLLLAVILILCYFGLYGNLRGSSPWDVFSMVRACNFKLSGYLIGGLILILIMVGMAIQERFFCRFLCPMGAIFAWLPVLPFFSLRRDRESCLKGCSACEKKCPADIGLPTDGELTVAGDCFQCQQCIDICPKRNIHCGISKLKGNEIWFTVLRAVVLAGILLWQGV